MSPGAERSHCALLRGAHAQIETNSNRTQSRLIVAPISDAPYRPISLDQRYVAQNARDTRCASSLSRALGSALRSGFVSHEGGPPPLLVRAAHASSSRLAAPRWSPAGRESTMACTSASDADQHAQPSGPARSRSERNGQGEGGRDRAPRWTTNDTGNEDEREAALAVSTTCQLLRQPQQRGV